MKKYILFVLLIISNLIFANDDITGYWYNAKNEAEHTAIIKIEKSEDNKYFGKIVKLKNPIYLDGENKGKKKLDLNNKNQDLRNRTIEGIKIIENFRYDEKNNDFRDGTIYNPEDGKVYYSYIKFQKDGKLHVRGSVDALGWFGKTRTWSRVEDKH
ncbi:DUF2147 domain-containing protein [Oceanivirga salmonicida]|uniref:DUF2147 domain-containing protein n=1 Tax=Oceanivirga salmonicida TaxID=1769291 RepID=UPI00082B2E7C|nr:DUF2147 domain-containing protein [Oceanivirga salmonicida]